MTAAAATTTTVATRNNNTGHVGTGQIVLYGDTTYTKVFVGGLAWETQKETMKTYFQQFGDILEAAVISDKSTGRSKGYGFVTFQEPEAAMRACVDAAPVIDGRRANCNLASMGVSKSKPSTPKHGGARRYKILSGFHHTSFQGVGTPFHSSTTTTTFPHYAFHQPNFPYNHVLGYSPYSSDYGYPSSYYNVYGGATGHHQYPAYGAAAGHGGMISPGPAATAYYPYFNQYGEANAAGTGAGGVYSPVATTGGNGYGAVQFPHHQIFQYSGENGTYPNHHYGTPISVSPTPALPSGVTMALHAPIPHHL